MPWTVDDPPPPARNWTREEREKCVAAANAVLEEGGDDEAAVFACIRAAGKSEDDKMAKRESLRDRVQVEHKSFPATSLKILDAEQGVVESVVAVFGNKDEGGDIIHAGAFGKTLVEGGRKIRVLDHHNSWSSRDVVGKPLELREVGREALPPETLARFPDATGGLFAKTQFALATQAGRETFSLLREGYIDEWSIGYDPIVADFDDEGATRNLRELRLWEYSPVIWGMNQGTATVSAKQQETEAADEKDTHPPSNPPLAVPKDLKDVVGRLIEALQDFQATTVSQEVDTEETDAEPPTVVSDAHEETNAVSDEGAGPESDGPSDTPPTSEDVDTLLAQADALLQEVNDELQRGTPGGARPD
jgi:phage head maturation protease